MWIKVCGITRLEDAVSAATFGADAVGFVFAASPRRVTPEQVCEISSRMPSGLQKVGVFVDSPIDLVREVVECCGLDLVQLHGGESPEYCAALGDMAIKAIRVDRGTDVLGASRYQCGALLFDSRAQANRGGTGQTFDWRLLHLLDDRKRVIVAGGLDPGNVAKAVRLVRPYGVDVSSGVEREPGVKDPVLMYEFIQNARRADYEVSIAC
jgi:phosphoribosylanthranilate isomerase